MLGKLAWHLMTEPQSLVTHLLKVGYYSLVMFREAGVASNPSYVWRSVLEARELVLSGGRIKVVSCESINVWNDPWIPDAMGTLTTAVCSELQDIK